MIAQSHGDCLDRMSSCFGGRATPQVSAGLKWCGEGRDGWERGREKRGGGGTWTGNQGWVFFEVLKQQHVPLLRQQFLPLLHTCHILSLFGHVSGLIGICTSLTYHNCKLQNMIADQSASLFIVGIGSFRLCAAAMHCQHLLLLTFVAT